MSDFTIFYAWQSDSPRTTNLNFIQAAIEGAIKVLKKDVALDLSPRLDRDTKGLAGAPAIADTILEKIRRSAMVVVDVTLVSTVINDVPMSRLVAAWVKRGLPLHATVGEIAPRKKSPNPNALIEAGNAPEAIGWDRVIFVMNTYFGPPEHLPFDLIHRRFPIRYSLGPGDSSETRATVKAELIDDLEGAFKDAHAAELNAAKKAIARLDVYSLLIIYTFRNADFFRDLGQDPARQEELKDVIDVPRFHAATMRLLDLGLIRTDVQGPKYAYHWTYLGRMVITHLAFPD